MKLQKCLVDEENAPGFPSAWAWADSDWIWNFLDELYQSWQKNLTESHWVTLIAGLTCYMKGSRMGPYQPPCPPTHCALYSLSKLQILPGTNNAVWWFDWTIINLETCKILWWPLCLLLLCCSCLVAGHERQTSSQFSWDLLFPHLQLLGFCCLNFWTPNYTTPMLATLIHSVSTHYRFHLSICL